MKQSFWRRNISVVPFLAPFLLVYAVFLVYPIIQGFVISLHKASLLGMGKFIWFDNYRKMVSDKYFWEALWYTVQFVLFSTPVFILAGLGLALIVNYGLKGTIVFRTVFFMPYVLAVSVVASIWGYILRPYNGLINSLLHLVGYEPEIFWLDNPNLAWISIAITTLWWTVGFNMVLYLAGLQDIPEDYYEAARMDGASAWQRLIYITLPSLKGVTVLAVMLQTIGSFKLFAQPWLMTSGGPGTSTRTLVLYIYQTGFARDNMGYASAMAYVLFAVTIVISFVQFRVFSGKKGGRA